MRWPHTILMWKWIYTPIWLRNCYVRYLNDLNGINTRLINVANMKFANICVYLIINYLQMSKWCVSFFAGYTSTIIHVKSPDSLLRLPKHAISCIRETKDMTSIWTFRIDKSIKYFANFISLGSTGNITLNKICLWNTDPLVTTKSRQETA